MINIGKLLAGYLVAEGCIETNEGCWSYTKDEIQEIIQMDMEITDEILEELVKYMSSYEQVAEVNVDYHDEEPYIDVTFYTGYCNID